MGIMSISEVLDKSIDVLKRHIKPIVLFALCYGIIMFIGIFILILLGSIFAVLAARPGSGYFLLGTIIFFSIILIISVSQTYNVGLIKISTQDFANEFVDLEGGIKTSFMSIPKVLGITTVAAFIFLPIALVLIGGFYLLYKSYGDAFFAYERIVAGETGYIVLTLIAIAISILMFYLYNTILAFSLHAMVIEKKGVFASIKRSYELVKVNFWKIFGVIVLISLVTYAFRTSIESFFVMIVNFLYLVLRLFNIKPDYIAVISFTLSIVKWPLDIFFTLIVAPIGTIMTSLLYFNQRFKKEGYDLVLRLREIRNKERKPVSESIRWNNSNQTRV